jgi:hypothetical protein
MGENTVGLTAEKSSLGESSMVGAAEGAIIKGIFERVAPHGIEWIKTLWSGKTLLVLGPERTGKTSFLDYLQYGLLRQEQPTAHTITIDPRRSFIVKLGRNGSLVLRIRRPLDSPGSVQPMDQIHYIQRYKPDCLLLILDSSSPLIGHRAVSSVAWLEEFFKHFDYALRTLPKVINKLRAVMVIMNKWDKISNDLEKANDFEVAIKNIIDRHGEAFSFHHQGTRLIHIKKCSLVQNQSAPALVDDVLDTLAIELMRV